MTANQLLNQVLKQQALTLKLLAPPPPRRRPRPRPR